MLRMIFLIKSAARRRCRTVLCAVLGDISTIRAYGMISVCTMTRSMSCLFHLDVQTSEGRSNREDEICLLGFYAILCNTFLFRYKYSQGYFYGVVDFCSQVGRHDSRPDTLCTGGIKRMAHLTWQPAHWVRFMSLCVYKSWIQDPAGVPTVYKSLRSNPVLEWLLCQRSVWSRWLLGRAWQCTRGEFGCRSCGADLTGSACMW